MTIKEASKKYSSIEIDLLLSYILGKPKEFLFMEPEHKLTIKQFNNLTKFIKRRQKGEPMAYILGYKDFYGLRFKVNRSVLIPRPETEELVNKVLKVCKVHKAKDKIKILDLATGSGCIAISIAKQLRIADYELVASDISGKALAVAKQNAEIHHAKIKFIKSDLFQNISGKFDVVIANLPYVPRKIYDLRFKELRFEPKLALTDGTNRFVIYQKFFSQIAGHLNQDSIIYLEIDPKAKPFIIKYTKKYLPGWQVKFYKDFNGLWRWAEIISTAGV